MSNEPNSIELGSPDGLWVAEFWWDQDRYAHRFVGRVDGDIAASSIEGDSSQDWPPSPPIQQLSLESVDDQPAVLGVGGAGRGHWSVSVLTGRDPSKVNCVYFQFDLACRSKREEDRLLGSVYRVEKTVEFVSPDSDCVESEDHLSRQQIRISPYDDSAETVTWSYRIYLPSSG